MTFLQRARTWLQPRLPYLNAGLVLAAYLANEYLLQAFCQPVRWAALVLLASVGAFLAWPWLPARAQWLRYLALLLQGALLPIGAYCVWFIGLSTMVASLALFLLVVPLLAWVPVWVAGQAMRRGLRATLPARLVFGLGVLGPLLAQGWAWGQYRQVAAAVATLPPAQRHQAGPLLRVVPRTYLAERLAGALFKYHNSPEMMYDGWRPPLHDPLVNVCLWLPGGDQLLVVGPPSVYGNYVDSDINRQAAFYHQLFPAEPVKVPCACAQIADGESYYAWRPGLTNGLGTPLAEVER